MNPTQQSYSRSPSSTRSSRKIQSNNNDSRQDQSDPNLGGKDQEYSLTGSPNTSAVLRAVYVPGCRGLTTSSAAVTLKELVALRHEKEHLIRENERKDKKYYMLSQDVVKLRAANLTQEHDVKVIRAMYEKLGIEKQLLANDYETCKEHCAKLERQFLRLGNGPALQAQVDMLKAQVDSLNKELSDCYSTIKSRDFAIKEMHVEIDALNIAFEKHVLYEGTGRSRYNGVGRETLRDLYHELGRKQAEIHSMSAALSEAHENHDKLQKSYDTAIEILQTTRVDLEKFRDANKELQELTEKRNDEIEVLRGHNNELRDAIANLEGVVADLSSRLAETHERAETLASEVASKTGALHELQLESSHTIATLSEKIESMGVSLEHRDNTIKLFEQRAAREREAMERERADMRARVAESSKWEAQFDTYRRSSLNALQEKDSRIVKLEDELQSALTRNDELLGKEALFERVVSERDVMSESLQRSLDASKSLFDKLQAEIAHRESLEAKLEDTTAQLNAATEQIHNFESVKHQYAYAILDAYQQERDKNIQLERILLLQKGSTGTSSTPDSNESGIAQSPGRSEINTSVPAIPPAFGAGLGASPAVTPTRNAASGLRIDPLASSAVDATLTATNGLLAPSQASADDSVLEANQNMVAQTHSILQKLQRIRGEMNKISEISPVSSPMRAPPSADPLETDPAVSEPHSHAMMSSRGSSNGSSIISSTSSGSSSSSLSYRSNDEGNTRLANDTSFSTLSVMSKLTSEDSSSLAPPPSDILTRNDLSLSDLAGADVFS